MKITCTKSELMNGINIALRAVPSKSVMPILESFLIAAKDDITITSNDNDMGIRTGIEGVVLESGMIAVEARLFSDIIRKLPENELTIESNASYKIRISCEGLEFHLNGNNPDEFPELPETGTTRKVTMSEFTLKEMIRQTIFSIAVNDSNALMKGELFSIKGDNLKVVSLDSHRISIRNEKLALSYEVPDRIPFRGDEKLLKKAIGNVLGNAITYTPAEGNISVSLCRTEKDVTLTIENGPAHIDEQHLPHLFEAFYRADASNKDGSGLGLYIAGMVLEMCGAVYEIKNQNKGVVFTVKQKLSEENRKEKP